MIQILLVTGKVLGIILLVLLGLVLLLLLVLLLVPIRYQSEGSWKGDISLHARVSWLLRIFSLLIECHGMEEGVELSLKIFGFRAWSSGKDEAASPEEEGGQEMPPLSPTEQDMPEMEEGISGSGAQEDELYRRLEEDEERYRREVQQERTQQKKTRPDKAQQDKVQQDKVPQDKVPPDKRIKAFFEKLKFSFTSFCDKLKGIRDKIEGGKAWLEDERNQRSIALMLRQLKRLIVHIWPGKGRVHVVFGFEDPYVTGQVLAGASLVYPFYHRRLELEPVFGEAVFEAEGCLKGRIRLWNLLWLLFGLYRDKHTRKLIFGFFKK